MKKVISKLLTWLMTLVMVVGLAAMMSAEKAEAKFSGYEQIEVDGGNITIITQPRDQQIEEGKTAVFTVEANGNGLNYQWQASNNGGKTWVNSGLNGNQTAILKVTADKGRNGYRYRCVITDQEENRVVTDEAALNVIGELGIVSQPKNQEVEEGKTASFTVEASGNGLSYQWQASNNGGRTWVNSGLGGNKTPTLKVVADRGRDRYCFRCVITDERGKSVTSTEVILRVTEGIKITSQPKNQEVEEGKTASFTVEASGSGLSYQWQASNNEGKSWVNSGLSGNKTASLTVMADKGRNGYCFRCVITDQKGSSVITEVARLSVFTELKITSQPKNQEAEAGKTVNFMVEASGNGVSYQWQTSNNGGRTWVNSGLSGNKTATLTVTADKGRNGYCFRCVISDQKGISVTTEVAVLSVFDKLKITNQPQNQEMEEGMTASFKVEADGSGLGYQWQASNNGGKSWVNSGLSGNKTATLKVVADRGRNGYRFRCVITDSKGGSVTTEEATLRVKTKVPSENEHSYEVTAVVEATCTKNGYTLETCKTCGETRKVKETQATGHDAGEWKVVQEAELGVTGSKELRCTKCQELLDTQEIPMLTTDGTDSVYYFKVAGGGQEMVIGHYNEEEAQEMLDLVNEYRVSIDMPALTMTSNQMNNYVAMRAVETSYLWDHTRPNGGKTSFSENIAMGYPDYRGNNPSVEQIFNAWLNSSGHKANLDASRILNLTGISVFYKRNPVYKDGVETGWYVYTAYWVEIFK